MIIIIIETVKYSTDKWTEDPLFQPDARKVHKGAIFIVYLSASPFLPPFPLHFLKLRYEKVFPFCNGPKTLVNSIKRANLHLTLFTAINISLFNVYILDLGK